eukprot:m.206516 g.206516  ORF g.206516 m.206516 type:complete len:576 (+) comp32956_c0_seq1:165-1892(+)
MSPNSYCQLAVQVLLLLTQCVALRALSEGTGASISVGAGVKIFADTVAMGMRNCSRNDLSNGTVCTCGISLEQRCGSVRNAGGDSCFRCAQTSSESECTTQMEQQFCCRVPTFDFRWIDDVPTPLKNVTPISGDDMNAFCLAELNSNVTSPLTEHLSRLENSDLEIFQVLGCDRYVLQGFAMQMGTPTLNANNDTNNTDSVLHGDAFDYLIKCCEDWNTLDCKSYGGPAVETFYKLLQKLTGCQRNLLEKEFEKFGVSDVDIGSSLFREFYSVDLRKMSFVIQPLIPMVFGLFYGNQLRFIVGLTLGAAAKHGRGNSWFMPGADRIYADTFKVQGDFYFPSTIPSPLETQGSCGTSSSSELVRLDVCEKMGTFMYDNARISGMSIIGCLVDCTGSRLESVNGAFVSISLIIIEIDTNSVGFGKQHGGLNASIDALNKEGMNVTNDVKATVGIGFHFAVDLLGTEDLLTTIVWGDATQHAKNYTTAEYFPNVTEAMLAYKIPKDTNSNENDLILTTWEVILIAAVVAVVLGVGIGVFIRSVKITGQWNEQHNNHSSHTDNVEYEDTQPLPALSSEA